MTLTGQAVIFYSSYPCPSSDRTAMVAIISGLCDPLSALTYQHPPLNGERVESCSTQLFCADTWVVTGFHEPGSVTTHLRTRAQVQAVRRRCPLPHIAAFGIASREAFSYDLKSPMKVFCYLSGWAFRREFRGIGSWSWWFQLGIDGKQCTIQSRAFIYP